MGKRQNLRGHVLFFWDMNDNKSLGNWFPTIQGNALHRQHSRSPKPALLMLLHPSRKHYILFKHHELITQQCSITPQKMTTSCTMSYVRCDRGRNALVQWHQASLCMERSLKSHYTNLTSNLFPVKVKVIPQHAEVAQGVPDRLRSRIFLTFGTTRVVGHQPYAPAAFTLGEIPGTHFQRLSRLQGTWFCWGSHRKNPQGHHQESIPGPSD